VRLFRVCGGRPRCGGSRYQRASRWLVVQKNS
jgi:hypothetical protein